METPAPLEERAGQAPFVFGRFAADRGRYFAGSINPYRPSFRR